MLIMEQEQPQVDSKEQMLRSIEDQMLSHINNLSEQLKQQKTLLKNFQVLKKGLLGRSRKN